MQKIINDLRYDTDTATRIHKLKVRATYYGRRTDKLTRKSLYKTANGRWFVHEVFLSGGQGEDIKPISASDAKEYIRARLGAEGLTTHFPVQDA